MFTVRCNGWVPQGMMPPGYQPGSRRAAHGASQPVAPTLNEDATTRHAHAPRSPSPPDSLASALLKALLFLLFARRINWPGGRSGTWGARNAAPCHAMLNNASPRHATPQRGGGLSRNESTHGMLTIVGTPQRINVPYKCRLVIFLTTGILLVSKSCRSFGTKYL